ncbi:MAG: 5-dehydro-4-deoxy-D-glucuronate isomerase [Planctomycetes bacterium]|nr:5-dehydro-4-deoxy-D-glucuronate isomerase [Planctomycetota bacterium]
MEVRYSPDPIRFERMTTEETRHHFLVESLFGSDEIQMIYIDVDRVIAGSVVPVKQSLALTSAAELRADFFCQRRELGVLNIGQAGVVTVDGKRFSLSNRDAMYIGRGSKDITFESDDSDNPAMFYLVSYPAHASYPTMHISKAQSTAVNLGSTAQANKRTIFKYIHPGGVQSCQLVMGFTELAEGCVWNTMPPHTHERRMEVYLYFDFPDTARVFHLMGKADQTRHIVVAPKQGVISPSWSLHSGVGTQAYSFCWAMGGENQTFDDMDGIAIADLK